MINDVIMDHYQVFEEFLDNLKVGVSIYDGEGRIIALNDESVKTGGFSKEQFIGRKMNEMLEAGYSKESSVLKAIELKREVSLVQLLGDGHKVFVTSCPIIKNGKIETIICTERDITETEQLKELLEKEQSTTGKYQNEIESLKAQNLKILGVGNKIIANSNVMKIVIEKALRIAKKSATVLLLGESGTGKDLFAELIHNSSDRIDKPFVHVNCAAIPEQLMESEFFGYEKGAFTGANLSGKIGYFEMADQGTLFLDEIGELPIEDQAKLLRVLQEKRFMRIGGHNEINVDVRIIAATNVDLEEAVRKGRFREDLYYRLNVYPIHIPPLRERKEDVKYITSFFINKFNQEYKLNKKIAPNALELLMNYQWPGNVRELRNMIERSMLSFEGEIITLYQISLQMNDKQSKSYNVESKNVRPLRDLIMDYEKKVIFSLMDEYHNASKVANILGINKSTMSKKLKKYQYYD